MRVSQGFVSCMRCVTHTLTSQCTHLPCLFSKIGASKTLLGSPQIAEVNVTISTVACCTVIAKPAGVCLKTCTIFALNSYLQFHQLCAQCFCGFVNAHSLMHTHCQRSHPQLKFGMQQTHAVADISNNSIFIQL